MHGIVLCVFMAETEKYETLVCVDSFCSIPFLHIHYIKYNTNSLLKHLNTWTWMPTAKLAIENRKYCKNKQEMIVFFAVEKRNGTIILLSTVNIEQ